MSDPTPVSAISKQRGNVTELLLDWSKGDRPLEWSKNWNTLKRRDIWLSQSHAAISLSQVSPG